MTAKKKVEMVCGSCGSMNIVADAHAIWNVDTQEWEVNNVFDKGHYCDDCEGECRIAEREFFPSEREFVTDLDLAEIVSAPPWWPLYQACLRLIAKLKRT